MAKRFTLNGDSNLERHLEAVCVRAAREIRLLASTERLEAVVLGGGYGRGEGGVLRGPDGDRPYNDMDFYVFCRGQRLINQRQLVPPLERLGVQLSIAAGLHIEFKVDSLRAFATRPVSMFSYDLVSGHRVLVGNQPFRDCEQHFDAGLIPLEEATRLLLNRCSGLLLSRELLQQSSLAAPETDFIRRNLAKAQLAFGDAVLACFGQYHWSCLVRRSRLEQLDAVQGIPFLGQIRNHHRAGVEFKLRPHAEEADVASLRARFTEVSRLAMEVWLWLESRRLRSPFYSVEEYAFATPSKCPGTSGVRNCLLNLKSFGWGSAADRMALRYPRERFLNSLPLLLWSEPSLSEPRIAKRIQNQLRTTAADWRGLVAAYKGSWPSYA